MRCSLAGVCSNGELKLGLQWTDPGRGLDSVWQCRDSPVGLECGPGRNWGHVQDEVWVCHWSPIVSVGGERCASAIALLVCSQWGMALDLRVL